MANTITTQALVNGSKNLVLKVDIAGDGSGDESATLLVDASAYNASQLTLMGVHGFLVNFTCDLLWDATANVRILRIPDYDVSQDFTHFGGVWNNAGTGKTGDVLLTTTGLGNNEVGTLILEFQKS